VDMKKISGYWHKRYPMDMGTSTWQIFIEWYIYPAVGYGPPCWHPLLSCLCTHFLNMNDIILVSDNIVMF